MIMPGRVGFGWVSRKVRAASQSSERQDWHSKAAQTMKDNTPLAPHMPLAKDALPTRFAGFRRRREKSDANNCPSCAPAVGGIACSSFSIFVRVNTWTIGPAHKGTCFSPLLRLEALFSNFPVSRKSGGSRGVYGFVCVRAMHHGPEEVKCISRRRFHSRRGSHQGGRTGGPWLVVEGLRWPCALCAAAARTPCRALPGDLCWESVCGHDGVVNTRCSSTMACQGVRRS